MPPSSFFPSTLFGAFLMCIPIFALYFFTRLSPRTKPIPANNIETLSAMKITYIDKII